ncbi:MAG TPA: M48 family metallopeptidase [Allosphingosinicella sp.]|nr:M48 family metallopeptidase [Allosphingosinicella sp.]
MRGLLRACVLGLLAGLGALSAASPFAPPAASSATAGSTLRRDDLRVGAAAYRLALAGRPLCRETWPLTGILFHHLAEYEPADRALMIARHGLDRGPGILAVVAGSPAAQAGVRAGDVLLAVGGGPFPSGAAVARIAKRSKWRALADASEDQLESALRGGPADIRLLRERRQLTVRLDSLPACLGRARLARSTQVNAFATGRTVVMTTSMLAFLRNDDELAVVLGHEMAHDILHHPATRTEEGILAGLGIKASAMWQREAAADRFGLRLMAAAGYDLDAAIPFWRRYLGKYDWFPQIFRSHPSLGKREEIAAREIAAIRAGR